MNLAFKYLPTLEAFASGEETSGRVALPAESSDEVGELAAELRRSQHATIELGHAIRALDDLVLTNAQGNSMEPLYRSVPEPLAGYVELVYDRANRPSVRFLEGLLFRGQHYRRDLQRMRLFAVQDENIASTLRTPRLESDGSVYTDAPFADAVWGEIERLRVEPASKANFKNLLSADGPALDALLTDAPPAPGRSSTVAGDRMRVRFFGHACLLFESVRAAVLVDPLIAPRHADAAGRLSFQDLPDRIDCVLFTHGHLDHLDIETLLRIRGRVARAVVPKNSGGDLPDPSLRLVLLALGFQDVIEIEEMESVPIPGGEVVGVPFFGEHSDLNVRAKSGYVVRMGHRAAFCTADARNLEPAMYRRVTAALGPVDVAFIGMECEGSALTFANGPYLAVPVSAEMSESRRTDASDSRLGYEMIAALGVRRAYVYAMGLEPWLAYMFGAPDATRSHSLNEVDRFIARCAERGIPAQLLAGDTRLVAT